MPDGLRCPGRIHALLIEDEDENGKPFSLWEVKCTGFKCGARSGVIVLHYFNTETLELVETKRRREPAQALERKVGR